MRLLPRIAAALALVGVLPVAFLAWRLIDLNREALRDQVKRTHALAARATGSRIDDYVGARQRLLTALAASPLLATDPQSPASLDLLSGILQSEPSLAAVVVRDLAGLTAVRAQRPGLGPTVDRVLAGLPGDPQTFTALRAGGVLWLGATRALASGEGTVLLLDRAEALPGLLRPEELGPEAQVVLVDRQGEVVVGSGGALPAELVELAASGRVSGAQATDREKGGVVAGLWPLAEVPWTVVSLQSRAVAEAAARRLRVQSLLAASLALLLVAAVSALAYHSLVRPLRRLLATQRELAGEQGVGEEARNELVALERSLAALSERVHRKEEIGRVFLGRYQVLEMLGAGGMGMVFRGWDPKLQRAVALKTVRLEHGAAGERRERMRSALLREAVATARFNHPHIVAIYDAQEGGDAAYVAMELVEGVTLERHMWARRGLPPGEMVPIALAVARGLAAAHARSLVHRDVKPSNVLLGFDGSIKIADFGLAAFLSSAGAMPDAVFGTPGYLAPEGLRGGVPTPAFDLFALGVLLYHGLAGRAPFAAPTIKETLLATLAAQPRPLGEVVPGTPAELRALVAELMAREPAHRPHAAVAVERLGKIADDHGWRWDAQLAPTPISESGMPSAPLAAGWLPTQRVAVG